MTYICTCRLEKIKKREERKKRIADNQVAIQKKEAEKKKKIEGAKNRIQHKQEEVKELMFLFIYLHVTINFIHFLLSVNEACGNSNNYVYNNR